MLHLPTHSFPTRRSADLVAGATAWEGAGITGLEGMRLLDSPDGRVRCYRKSDAVPRRTRWTRCRLDSVRCHAAAASGPAMVRRAGLRSEDHKSELQALLRISYSVFCF